MLYGARISLAIGIVASLLNPFYWCNLWRNSRLFCGGKIDRIMMNIVDILYSVPTLLYVILLMVSFKARAYQYFYCFRYWLLVTDGKNCAWSDLSMKEQEFILAARTIGVSQKKEFYLDIYCQMPWVQLL